MADQPRWMRVLIQLASRRATDAELGDVVEEYNAAGKSAAWFIGQILSIVRRRRARVTMTETGVAMLMNVRNDLRYAIRTLRRSPGFAVAAILPLALGIGINTGVFAILNSVAWRPLPVPDADALVSVHQESRGGPTRIVHGARSLLSIPEYRAYRDGSHTLTGLMAYTREWNVTLGREAPREIQGILVTCNYFEVLSLRPALGAGFTPANCGAADAPPAVVLSHALWRSAFSGDPQILQKPIVLNGREVTVVGVAPSGFDGIDMAKAAFFAPTSLASVLRPDQSFHENPSVSWLTLIGRRRSDASLAQVRSDLSVIAGRIDREQPGRTTSLIVEPGAALSLPVQRRMILRGAGVVLTAFGLVLLIAAANVANILLARAGARRREIAIRFSVGASRGRLVQQLLTESAVVAIAGAGAGLAIFTWTFQALLPRLLASLPDGGLVRIDAAMDRTVLYFALGLTAATTLAFGLVPALQTSRGVARTATRLDAGSDGRRGWMRGALIGAQIALCTMLLIPAGLLSRALQAAYAFDPGFDHHEVAVVSIDLRGPRFDRGQAAIFHDQWLERVRALPGVAAIAQASRVPLGPGRSQATLRVGDRSESHIADVNTVSPEFFAVLELPVVRGRVFSNEDAAGAMVTESTALRYWPGQDAVGQTITMGTTRRQIVGIVRDAQLSQARDANDSYVFLPAPRGNARGISVLVRTRLDIQQFAAAVRADTSRMHAGLVVNVKPLSDQVALLQTMSRITAGVAGVLSALALGLAAIGIYGVVAYVVSGRRREIGVRMALGAVARDVQWMVMRQTLRPVVIGMGIGVTAAAAITRLLQAVLLGVSPYDPVAFVAAPVIMLGIAGVAAFVPVRRAMRVNPVSALRTE